MQSKHIQHLYWRIGFGILPNTLAILEKKNKKKILNNLFLDSQNSTPLEIKTPQIDAILNSMTALTDADRKKIQDLSRKKTIELNAAWVDRLTNPKELLREKMTLFWSNVFVCQDNNIIYTKQFHNTIRKHALGSFSAFVKAISKEASMTKYLNTKQNRKQKPNENFARELMELFTLGEGHYTEQDIKESARAFTGYSHNLQGNFVLKLGQHDNNLKTFFGKTGNFSGDDIIDIILEQKQCAKFICEKIYRYFVNNTLNLNCIDEMVQVFYPNYDIETLMRHVVSSNWFYKEENMGVKIKSPIEFLVGIKNLVPIEFQNKKQLVFLQKQLGQILFNPPNVAGWKGDKNWINSNTIVLRLKLASILLNKGHISITQNGDSNLKETKEVYFGKKQQHYFKTQVNWDAFDAMFNKIKIDDLKNHILLCKINSGSNNYLNTLEKKSKRDYCIQLMSLPEYQMC